MKQEILIKIITLQLIINEIITKIITLQLIINEIIIKIITLQLIIKNNDISTNKNYEFIPYKYALRDK